LRARENRSTDRSIWSITPSRITTYALEIWRRRNEKEFDSELIISREILVILLSCIDSLGREYIFAGFWSRVAPRYLFGLSFSILTC
jgi:hypothetical protein